MCAQKYMPNVNYMLPFMSTASTGDVKKTANTIAIIVPNYCAPY